MLASAESLLPTRGDGLTHFFQSDEAFLSENQQ
jgi:hypothetical protein